MQIKQQDFTKLLSTGFNNIKSILIYGKDRGKVLEFVKQIPNKVAEDPTDVFSVFNYNISDIEDDVSKLFNDITSVSFNQTRKIITVKDITDSFFNKIIEVFNIINPSDCLLILSSGDLGTTSPLRKFFETKTDDLISFPCYEDEDKTLQQFITDYLKENGISKIDTDAIKFLINNLGSNRELTKNELDKLSLYLYGQDTVKYDNAVKMIADSSSIQTQDLTFAVFSGETEKALNLYPKVLDLGETPTILVHVFEIHIRKLLSIHEAILKGMSTTDALKINGIRFFKIIPTVTYQIKLWNVKKLLTALEILIEMDMKCKIKDAPTEILVSDCILKLSRFAKKEII